MKRFIILFYSFFLGIITIGCKDFLDVRPDKSLVIPSTLEGLQAILDDYNNIVGDPTYGEISADDYYLTNEGWSTIPEEGHRRAYMWEKDYLFSGITFSEWLNAYRNVYKANTILEKLDEIERNEKNKHLWDDVKGQAYFLRARSFLSVANIWALGYDPSTAKKKLGIPLRLESDFNIQSQRSTLEETYATILDDLNNSISLLPIKSIHPSRASKIAALALQARTYLFMRDYENCRKVSDECLKLKDNLMDFNHLDPKKTYPIAQFNEEVIYVSQMASPQPLRATRAKIDFNLMILFDKNDLRKVVYFQDNTNGSFGFRGSYQGSITLFSGLATDELYLMRAECQVRNGNIKGALDDLNKLLKSRWDNKTDFKPVEVFDKEQLLDIILLERRKELIMRGIRWPDIKRLNLEGRDIKLVRMIKNQTVLLEPNDLRYALTIPESVIEISKIEQNPR